MKPNLIAGLLLSALAAGSGHAQETFSIAGTTAPMATGYAPGLYGHPSLEGIDEYQPGTYLEFSDIVDGLSSRITAALSELLDAELQRDLQQQGAMEAASELSE